MPSVEGQGILVTELAEAHGITFLNGSDVVTWFSLILYFGQRQEACPASEENL